MRGDDEVALVDVLADPRQGTPPGARVAVGVRAKRYRLVAMAASGGGDGARLDGRQQGPDGSILVRGHALTDTRLLAAGLVAYLLVAAVAYALLGNPPDRAAPKATVAQTTATVTAAPQVTSSATRTATAPVHAPRAARSAPTVDLPTGTLRPGDRGTQVATLQKALARAGYSPGRPDGSYGAATKTAVTDFQRAADLSPADGISGPQTLAALKRATTTATH